MTRSAMSLTYHKRRGAVQITAPKHSARLYDSRSHAGWSHTCNRSNHPLTDKDGFLRPSAIIALRGSLDRLAGGIRRRHRIETVTTTVYRLKRN